MSKTGKEYYPESSFEYLYEIEDAHWWFRARNSLIIWTLREKVGQISRFLEIGCGTGFVLGAVSAAFPHIYTEGGEYYAKGLEVARLRLGDVNIRLLDATKMHQTQEYDCIGLFDVLEHIRSDRLVLDNIYKALTSRGYLVMTVPQHPWLWSDADIHAQHVRRYTAKELAEELTSAGFRVVYMTSFVSLLLPLMTIQRLVPSLLRRVRSWFVDQKRVSAKWSTYSYKQDDEFRIHKLLNSFLFIVQMFEFYLVRFGLRFPFGGSLLVVAQKR